MAKISRRHKKQDARRNQALQFRTDAAIYARSRETVLHENNGDEEKYKDDSFAMSFTKGLKHEPATLLVSNPAEVVEFRSAMDFGKVSKFNAIKRPLGDKRQWEAPTAALSTIWRGQTRKKSPWHPRRLWGLPSSLMKWQRSMN